MSAFFYLFFFAFAREHNAKKRTPLNYSHKMINGLGQWTMNIFPLHGLHLLSFVPSPVIQIWHKQSNMAFGRTPPPNQEEFQTVRRVSMETPIIWMSLAFAIYGIDVQFTMIAIISRIGSILFETSTNDRTKKQHCLELMRAAHTSTLLYHTFSKYSSHIVIHSD